MTTCDNCLWRRLDWASRRKYCCALAPKYIRFNSPRLHGWMCRWWHAITTAKMDEENASKLKKIG